MTALRYVLLASLAAACCQAQLIGIDFGSEFIKVAGVRPSSGIDVVLNEQSKRKSNNYIGFRGEDRFLGEDAHNLAPRFPTQMYTFLNRLAGHKWADKSIHELFHSTWNLPYDFVENKNRSTIDISHADPEIEFTAEELVAQLLGYIKWQADKHLEIPVSGAVITLPRFFTIDQRQAFYEAANLTGLPILGFMETTLSAALHYGVQRRGFGNDTVHLVIYDMGSSKTECGVFRFTPPEMEKGKPKKGAELGQLQQLSVTYDETLGGRTFDARIANFLARKFEEKTGIKLLGTSDKGALKAMTVLMKAANKAKEVLSANKDAAVAVEELYEGKPFFYTMSRQELDEECDDIFQLATPLLTQALVDAGITVENVTAVEVIGGGIRIPRLQVALSEALGGRSLDKTLNGDECMALGATFQAARLSKGSFRTKGFDIVDSAPYNVSFRLSQKPGGDKEPKMRPLFTKSRLGTKKSITVSRDQDFDVNLFLSKLEGGEEVFTQLRSYHIQDVAKTLDSFGFNKPDKNETNVHSVNVVIELTHAGLIELSSVTVKYDENVEVIKKIKVKESKNETKAETAEEKKDEEKADGSKAEEGDKKEDEEKEGEQKEEPAEEKAGDEADKKDEDGEKKDDEKTTIKKKVVTKKHRQAVPASVTETVPAPMGAKDYTRSRAILAALQKIDDIKREAASAKNDLETYMYWVKYDEKGVLDNEGLQEFITEEEKEKLVATLEEYNDWVEYGEGSDDSTKSEAYTERRLALVKMVKGFTDKKKAKEDAEKKAAAAEEKTATGAEEAPGTEDAEKAEKPAEETAEEADNGEDETEEM